jgi:divalent metal cation (Fe/Co/Zn/Cd) transporter
VSRTVTARSRWANASMNTLTAGYARFMAVRVQTPIQHARVDPGERERLERRARLLAWGGNAWHIVEFAIAVGAGVAAGSIALFAFGVDSLIEVAAGLTIIWRFSGSRLASATSERTAQQIIAFSYFLLAAYVAVESVRDLAGGHEPGVSWVGIGLAAFTAPTMPLLARAKRKVGHALGSAATVGEGGQNMICAYLSIALLAGLLLNALAGWWWADPVAALVIGAVAVREGVESWRGDACCDAC